MPLPPKCLLGPRHLHPGVNTEADYRRAHRDAIARGRARYPNLEWPEPWLALFAPSAFVAGGMWQLRCATVGCTNCPSVSPEWRLALCWDCGAVYERVPLPVDIEAIERVLMRRPDVSSRNWLPTETVEDLVRENAEHGIQEAA